MAEEEKKVKPGWKTTEFWFTAAACIVGLVMASGGLEAEGTMMKGLGLAASALASMGYSFSRGLAKK